jgi:hypothetical protein
MASCLCGYEIPFVLIAETKITLEEARKAVGSFKFSPIIEKVILRDFLRHSAVHKANEPVVWQCMLLAKCSCCFCKYFWYWYDPV